MTAPPKYPRVPHVAPSPAATSDDLVLSADERAALLGADVVVEEKLDGMNVMIWVEDGTPCVGTRGGAATSDRSGERGRIRAWASTHGDLLVAGLGDRRALYAEWLRRRHGVPYARLPSPLVGVDVLDERSGRFLDVDARDDVLRAIDVPGPPVRFRGPLRGVEELSGLLGPSAFADGPAEGLVIRRVDGAEPRVAKLLDLAWTGIGSAPWAGETTFVPVTVRASASRRWSARADARPVRSGDRSPRSGVPQQPDLRRHVAGAQPLRDRGAEGALREDRPRPQTRSIGRCGVAAWSHSTTMTSASDGNRSS